MRGLLLLICCVSSFICAEQFEHVALTLQKKKPVVFTALSKHSFYYKLFIVKYALEHNAVPLNPFMSFDYFMLDTVERDAIRAANNNVLMRCDELWVFGPISDGVLAEIWMAKGRGMPIRFFSIENGITEIFDQMLFEDEKLKEYLL